MSESESPWMTVEEVCKYLGGVHEATVRRYRDKGMPVHYLAANKQSPRYHRDEVDAWIKKQAKANR